MEDALHCRNCDGMMAAGRCISCGWTVTDGIGRDTNANPYKHHRYADQAAAEEPAAEVVAETPEPVEEPTTVEEPSEVE